MMMLSMISKRIHCSTILPFLITRFFSASPVKNPDPKTPHFSVIDYLVNSCGLSCEKAVRIHKPISYLKSPENPDAIRRLLNDMGFTEAEMKTIITWTPSLLCSPEKSLRTNLGVLRDIGLSTSVLNEIIHSGPNALQLRDAVPRIKFWMDYFGRDEAVLLKLFKRNRGLVSRDISKAVVPKLALLQKFGLSTQDIQRILLNVPRLIVSSTHFIEDLLNRTTDLGFQRGSKMFVQGLFAMACCSKETLQRKMESFKRFGWSEDDFHSALHMAPRLACISEDSLQVKMHFLIGEARCEPSYVTSHPMLLNFSLEKRLRPRHNVLKHLEMKGLVSGKKRSFSSDMKVPDSKFAETYILPYKEQIAGLHEAYIAASA